MAVIDLVTDGLAVFRLTRLLTTDRIAQPYRDWMKSKGEMLGELSKCDWCTSIYIGLGVVAVARLAPKAWRPLARGLAMSAAAGIIASYT